MNARRKLRKALRTFHRKHPCFWEDPYMNGAVEQGRLRQALIKAEQRHLFLKAKGKFMSFNVGVEFLTNLAKKCVFEGPLSEKAR